ncbi:hypothetical protein [Helicobacter marmotae]|uniref:hypothetical protein n=1 Tax=Helicobacter marmotae TaxID=152490 RepID=UPI0011C0319F|nr:hypothetical protein [Helicobacter marmotae]
MTWTEILRSLPLPQNDKLSYPQGKPTHNKHLKRKLVCHSERSEESLKESLVAKRDSSAFAKPQNDKITESLVIRAEFPHNAWNDKNGCLSSDSIFLFHKGWGFRVIISPTPVCVRKSS